MSKMYPKEEGIIFASAARTASINSNDAGQIGLITNNGARGVHIVIDVTAATATPSVVFTLQGFDAASGKYYDLLVSSAITAISTTVLKLYPGIATVANGAASDVLPRMFRIKAVHADSDSITYSVGFSALY